MKPTLWRATFLILPLLCLAKTWASPLLPIPQDGEPENEGEEEAEETDGEEEDEDEEVEQSETTTENAEYETEVEGGGEVEVEEEASSDNSTESILLPHEKTKKPFGYSMRFRNSSSIADTTIDDYQNATVIKSKSKSTTTTDNSVKYLTTAIPKKTTTTPLPTVITRKALSYSVRYRKRLSTTEKTGNGKNIGLSTSMRSIISTKPSTKKSFSYSEKFKLSNITAPLIAPVTENEDEADFSADTTVNVVGDDEGENADTTISPDSGVKPSIFRPKYLTTLEPSLDSGETENENATKSGAKMNVTREYTFLTPDGNNITIELNGLFGENEIDGQDVDLGKVELLSPEELEEEEALKNIEDAIMEALGLGDYASSTTSTVIAETEVSKEPVGASIAGIENTTSLDSNGKRFIEFVIPENVSDWESIINQQLLNFELNHFNREEKSESEAPTTIATTSTTTTPSAAKLAPLHYYEIPELVELFSEIDSEETETKKPPTKPTPPPGPTTTPVPKSLTSFVYYPARGVVENVVELLDTRWFNNITKRWECALTNYCPWQTPISFENGLEVDEDGLK